MIPEENVVEGNEVIEEPGDIELEDDIPDTAPDPTAEKIATLEKELAEMREKQWQPETEPEPFEPEPLFTDEDYEELDNKEKKLYMVLNQMHMDKQLLQNKLEKIESVNEEANREKGIDNFIATVPELNDNPAMARAFRNEINAVMRGNGNELLDAIKLKVLSSQKKRPASMDNIVTRKPRSVAGSLRTPTAPSGTQSVEQGLAKAKEKTLQMIREGKL